MLGLTEEGTFDHGELEDIRLEQEASSVEHPCPCGSGNESWWLNDARGIPCSRVCDDCEEQVQAKYRPEIFEDPNYYCEERIEDDY